MVLNYMISQNDRWANGGGGVAGRRNIAVGKDADGNWTADPYEAGKGGGPVGVSFNTLQMRIEIAF
jgi:hypothetical protein